jgi:O-antigen ligase
MLYFLGIPKLFIRDPLSQEAGPQAIIELASLGAAFACAASAALMTGKVRRLPPGVVGFLLFGAVTLLSSANSFWPALSTVKAITYICILVTALLWCSVCDPLKVLFYIYCSIVLLCLLAIVLGIALPGTFPLFTVDEYSSRMRLSLFGSEYGGIGSITAIGFLLGRIKPLRVWPICQWLMFILTAATGGRAGILTLVIILAAGAGWRYVREHGFDAPFIACAFLMAFILVGFWFSASGGTALRPVSNAIEAFYGEQRMEDIQTLDGRTEVFPVALALAAAHPAIGWGMDGARNSLLRAVPWAGEAHNAYLDLLVSGGAAGFLLFVAGMAFCFRDSLRMSADYRRHALAIQCWVAIVAMIAAIFRGDQSFGVVIFVCLSLLSSRPAQFTATAGEPKPATASD